MKPVWSLVAALVVGAVLGCGAGIAEVSEEDSPGEVGVSSAAIGVCGDGICTVGERVGCPQDCPPVCGDNVCCWETQAECPTDCYRGDSEDRGCYKTSP